MKPKRIRIEYLHSLGYSPAETAGRRAMVQVTFQDECRQPSFKVNTERNL